MPLDAYWINGVNAAILDFNNLCRAAAQINHTANGPAKAHHGSGIKINLYGHIHVYSQRARANDFLGSCFFVCLFFFLFCFFQKHKYSRGCFSISL